MVSADLPTPTPSPTPLGVINHDLHCINCQYNLRGLDAMGKCPECAAPITSSISTRSRVSPAQWRVIHRSLVMVIAANLGLVLILIVAVTEPWTFDFSLILPDLLIALVIAGMVVLRTVGYSRFAATFKTLDHETLEWNTARIIQGTSWVRATLGCLTLCNVLLYARFGGQWPSDSVVPFLILAFLAYCTTAALQFPAVTYSLITLGHRSPRPILANSVGNHILACVLGIVPGSLFFGLGLIVTWLSYHLLLARFAIAARQFASSESGPA
jgi:hypothetical protein